MPAPIAITPVVGADGAGVCLGEARILLAKEPNQMAVDLE